MSLKILAACGVASCLIWSTGCAKKVAAVATPAAPVAKAETPAPAPAARPAVTARAPETPRAASATRASNQPSEATKARIQELLNRIQDAYFDYNQQNIRPDAQAALRGDAQTLSDILRQYPDYKLTIEGYADERGSDAYNLALADARAKRAREFLTQAGIPESQLKVVSYGKERQVCSEHTEECWQKNRRAHITQAQ
jgi:peptidoglycan-associated lipoprotein